MLSTSEWLLFEYYVRELFNGNSYYWSELTISSCDKGVDLEVYDRRDYYDISILFQLKNQSKQISMEEVLNDYNKSQEIERYKNKPFHFLSLSGYSFDENMLKNQCIVLHDWTYVERLIKNYDYSSSRGAISEKSFYKDFIKLCKSLYSIKGDLNLEEIEKFYNNSVEFYRADDRGYIGAFITKVRSSYKKGELHISQVRALDKIGFWWSHSDLLWEISYIKFKKAFDERGSLRDMNVYEAEKNWIKENLRKFLNKELKPIQIEKLNDINFINEWLPIFIDFL